MVAKMNKNFKYIKDFIKDGARVCTVVLAGISFTLFGASEDNSAPYVFEEVVQDKVAEESVKPAEGTPLEVVLISNQASNIEKLDNAFEKFKDEIGEDASHLKNAFSTIRNELAAIKFDKVAVDGNPTEGIINVAFRLPDGMILSVNKRLGLQDDSQVGFNLIHNRQLLISDMLPLYMLKNYIDNVQRRLV